ncbi:MAG: helix-turn-helix domain-containing protein [Burkholderiales bacterium]
MKLNDKITNPRQLRRSMGLNQQQFWNKIGVTQSGGSRYENGRDIPRPVKELLRLVHVKKIDVNKIQKEDYQIIRYMKASQPGLYNKMKKAARGKTRLG